MDEEFDRLSNERGAKRRRYISYEEKEVERAKYVTKGVVLGDRDVRLISPLSVMSSFSVS